MINPVSLTSTIHNISSLQRNVPSEAKSFFKNALASWKKVRQTQYGFRGEDNLTLQKNHEIN